MPNFYVKLDNACLHSWGEWQGGSGAEEDKRSGEDLHHHPRGHLQFWLHRSLSLLFCDGRFGKMCRCNASLQVASPLSVNRSPYAFARRDLPASCTSPQTRETASVGHCCHLPLLSRWETHSEFPGTNVCPNVLGFRQFSSNTKVFFLSVCGHKTSGWNCLKTFTSWWVTMGEDGWWWVLSCLFL